MEKKDELIDELSCELNNILEFWSTYAVDQKYGGFAGEIDANGDIVEGAEKGLVLNARILWTFSVAYNFLQNETYLELAHRTYDYLTRYFWDNENGGLYWAVDFKGNIFNPRKQIYGQAFGIYAFSEYFKASGKRESLEFALELFDLIEKYSSDTMYGGYLEAFSANWEALEDVRLSAKDANSPKSMNTHLHILESYSNLYRVWKTDILKDRIKSLVRIFLDKIINKETGHFHLFFDMDWTTEGNIISYGHDIEGAWLINEAAGLFNDACLLEECQKQTLKMVDAVLNEGLAADYSLLYEYDLDAGELNFDRHWWVQGEALVGLLDAYEHSGNLKYFDIFLKIWCYISNHVIDHEKGGWFGIIDKNGQPRPNEVKGGFWKCPYHNTRAMIECIRGMKNIQRFV
jgi:mannobiose 2-epimerase